MVKIKDRESKQHSIDTEWVGLNEVIASPVLGSALFSINMKVFNVKSVIAATISVLTLIEDSISKYFSYKAFHRTYWKKTNQIQSV